MASTTAAALHISHHELFNRKLRDFMDDLKPIIGHLPEFSLVSKSVLLLANLEPKKNQELFNFFIAQPYEARVMSRDENFFLERGDQLCTEAGGSAGLMPMLRQVWSSLLPADREAVWAHMQVLLVLNRRCLGLAPFSGPDSRRQ